MTTETLIDSRAQVILVDDDPHLRQALSQTLDLAGLKVTSLADARGRLPMEKLLEMRLDGVAFECADDC